MAGFRRGICHRGIQSQPQKAPDGADLHHPDHPDLHRHVLHQRQESPHHHPHAHRRCRSLPGCAGAPSISPPPYAPDAGIPARPLRIHRDGLAQRLDRSVQQFRSQRCTHLPGRDIFLPGGHSRPGIRSTRSLQGAHPVRAVVQPAGNGGGDSAPGPCRKAEAPSGKGPECARYAPGRHLHGHRVL